MSLLVNDWTGDVQYLGDLFYKSLHDYEPLGDSLIRLKSSGLVLHIRDIGFVNNEDGWIEMLDPSKLFNEKESKLSTLVIYYEGDIIHQLNSSHIGGIGGILGRSGVEAIGDICSLKLEFRNGEQVYRVFFNPKKELRVVHIMSDNGYITHWREVKRYKTEY